MLTRWIAHDKEARSNVTADERGSPNSDFKDDGMLPNQKGVPEKRNSETIQNLQFRATSHSMMHLTLYGGITMSASQRNSRLQRRLMALTTRLPQNRIQQVLIQEVNEGEEPSRTIVQKYGLTTLIIRLRPGDPPMLPSFEEHGEYKLIAGPDPADLV